MFSKMAMQYMRQAPGRDIHRHFSLAPARSHTITASNKASATAATRNPPPHPDPYKTGPKLAKRRRGHRTCHSFLSLPPAHLPPALPHAPPHLKPRVYTDGEGRRNSARLCVTVVRCSGSPPPSHRTRKQRQLVPPAWQKIGPSDAVGLKGHALISTTSPLSPIPLRTSVHRR